MIKTIIFDFGDVFINLDKTATDREFSKLGVIDKNEELVPIFIQYEIGKISTSDFIAYFLKHNPNLIAEQIIHAWNAILIDFPEHRLQFIQQLAAEKNYKLILLSNTNELHIKWIKEHISFYSEFKNCFDAFYLSHEIHVRKPTTDIFQFVIEIHQLNPSEILFIDDTKENTDTASGLGMHVWNHNPKTEDITDLLSIKSNLF